MLTFPKVSYSCSEQMTQSLGHQIGATLSGGSTVALHGDLGSGKTVFTRGIAKGMGISEPITSPTFNLVQEYQGEQWTLYHIDLYRINNEYDALSLGIEDFFYNNKAVTVVEWAERAQEIIENIYYQVYIAYEDLTKRRIDINFVDSSYEEIWTVPK